MIVEKLDVQINDEDDIDIEISNQALHCYKYDCSSREGGKTVLHFSKVTNEDDDNDNTLVPMIITGFLAVVVLLIVFL